MDFTTIKALTFDVFGTVVDWRSSIIREGQDLGRRLGIEADWASVADAWRGRYNPSMERVRSGERGWVKLDQLHRENLLEVLEAQAISGLSEAEIDHFNRAWHRLDPWPDAVPGLSRLKQRYILATLSNGNVALMVNMARHSGLPWDAILGAETARAYKPRPEAYLRSADFIGLEPGQIMMVAAHNGDLIAAGNLGFHTAFIHRPTEYGPNQATDLQPERDYDCVAASLQDLADQLLADC